MKYLIAIALTLTACATTAPTQAPSPMAECKALCQGGRVETFSNDDLTCKCRLRDR